MTAPLESDLARALRDAETIPSGNTTTISVTIASVAQAGALDAFRGRRVYLRARGGNVTISRGTATLVAGAGFTLADGTGAWFYVPASLAPSTTLNVIGSAACSLDIVADRE